MIIVVLINVDNNSSIEPYKNRGLGSQNNVGVYCTISLIAMHGVVSHKNTEYTGSLSYNSVYRKIRSHLALLIVYITSRIGWVSLKGI